MKTDTDDTEAPVLPSEAVPAMAPVIEPEAKPNGHSKPARKAKAKAARGVKAKAKQAKAKPAKAKGAKPKAKVKTKAKARTLDPKKRDEYGLRLGSVKSKAAAMYASSKGATLMEVKKKLGSIQFNVISQLEEAGHKIKRTEETGVNNRTVTRFHLA